MDFLFIVGIAQAFFFALLLGKKKDKSVADKILLVWLIFIGLHLLGFYWDYSGFSSQHPHLLGFSWFMPIAEGPFLWIYAAALLSGAKRFNPWWLIHFVPFVLLNVSIYDFYLSLPEQKAQFAATLWENPPWQAVLGNFLTLYSGPVYVLFLLVRLKRFRSGLRDFFSSTERINLQWLQRLTWGLGGIWAVVLGTYAYCRIADTRLPDNNNYYIFIAVSLFVLFLGYHGLKYENILVKYASPDVASDEAATVERYKKSGLKPTDEKALLNQIKSLLVEQELYLEQNLTLDDLAKKLDKPRHYISQAIGSEEGLTFYSLVNQLRVEAAKEKLVSDEFAHFSLLGIGLDSGFNSKASFNRVFKEYAGISPSEHRERHQKIHQQ
ncbi:AraC family transcriptional regulator [uncultured Imperialibacter sp.]|uniref:helix-turn-helix domain-containing protein n=1 Tax=uncultured Imperialibacter sp. TaxID=1672639 RepID=UPI0030D8A293|tara:strand:+ start:2511 stop:3653 length:1143 start_codon:yes stop_codon:yes gene_type:complete